MRLASGEIREAASFVYMGNSGQILAPFVVEGAEGRLAYGKLLEAGCFVYCTAQDKFWSPVDMLLKVLCSLY